MEWPIYDIAAPTGIYEKDYNNCLRFFSANIGWTAQKN